MPEDAEPDAQASESELLSRILAGDKELFGELVRRYNRRLYRISRAILQSDDQAEDVVQESFVRAFEHLRDFEGRALFSTWLTRIAFREALGRKRQQRREASRKIAEAKDRRAHAVLGGQERSVLRDELRRHLEAAIDALPESYRLVFVMRHIEEMSTAETAKCLGLSEETVKARLVRARTVLRRHLTMLGETGSRDAFQWLGERCDRLTAHVLARITARPPLTCK